MKLEITLRGVMMAAALMLALSGCAVQHVEVQNHESLNATLWTQTAAEYNANTRQTYRNAASSLDLALADTTWSAALEQTNDYSNLPPAVMLDLDQTVLDTSTYNARIVLEYGAHSSKRFSDWCHQTIAPAVPGVMDFVDYAVQQDVAIIYYSARPEALRGCTTDNLRTLGLPLPDQRHLLLRDGTPSTDKVQLRARSALAFRILLLVGDNLDDFIGGSKADAAARRALARQHAHRWGREWIVLPNPMYGDWEFSLYEFDYTLPREKQREHKLQQLQQ